MPVKTLTRAQLHEPSGLISPPSSLSPWLRLWQRSMLLTSPHVEIQLPQIAAISALQGESARLFVDELGKILQEFSWLQRAEICNVQTCREDWQLLLVIESGAFVLASPALARWCRRWLLWRLQRRLQGLLAINLLCRQHCPESVLVCLEPVLLPVYVAQVGNAKA